MSTTSHIIFKAFLDSCPPDKREALMSCLPDSEVEILRHLSPPVIDLSKGINTKGAILDTFHTSWFEPFLRSLGSHDLSLLLASFSSAQSKRLSQDIGFTNTLPTLTQFASTYLRFFLMKDLKKDTIPLLPLECIPSNPFNLLLSFSYTQKLKLIDLLSMYALDLQQKNIKEKPNLSLIASILSEEEKTLLKRLSKQEEILSFKSMKLNKWSGDPTILKTLLRQRGLNRLSKATFGSDPSFQWYLCHQLDTTAAALFQKLHTSLDNPEATKALQEQTLSLIDIFKDQLPKEGQQL